MGDLRWVALSLLISAPVWRCFRQRAQANTAWTKQERGRGRELAMRRRSLLQREDRLSPPTKVRIEMTVCACVKSVSQAAAASCSLCLVPSFTSLFLIEPIWILSSELTGRYVGKWTRHTADEHDNICLWLKRLWNKWGEFMQTATDSTLSVAWGGGKQDSQFLKNNS